MTISFSSFDNCHIEKSFAPVTTYFKSLSMYFRDIFLPFHLRETFRTCTAEAFWSREMWFKNYLKLLTFFFIHKYFQVGVLSLRWGVWERLQKTTLLGKAPILDPQIENEFFSWDFAAYGNWHTLKFGGTKIESEARFISTFNNLVLLPWIN